MTEYPATTTTGNCPFCEIAQGTLTTPGIFWQNDEFMAFLSTYPNTKGFTIVIPKQHYESDVLGMNDLMLSKFIIAAKQVSMILLNYFQDVGRVGLMMEGTGINHAQIKLFPMHGTENLKNGQWKQYPSKINTLFPTYEGYFSSNDGPRANENELTELANELRSFQIK
jgi:diadenosine tetraphosphate (Ap4A) HIT family hydrolase